MKSKSRLRTSLLLFFFCSAWLHSEEAQEANPVKWTDTGSLFFARTLHTATLMPNGKVLIVGGHGYADDLAGAELYDFESGLFTQTSDLNPGRADNTATMLSNGQVLVVGGQSNGKTLANADLYNPSTGAWTHTGSLHIARAFHTATLLANGQVLVVGGVRTASPPVFAQGAPSGSALDIVELYDPASGKWTVTDNLHTARYVHTATLLNNGQVLVTGGMGPNAGANVLSSAELYNPESKTWTVTDSLHDSRFAHTATLLSNGQVLVAGGQANGSLLSSAELYNPWKESWTSTENLHFIHSGHTATLLPTGDVLVVGGSVQSGVSNNVEVYNPVTEKWGITSALKTARLVHTATLLPNGKLLVAGGSNGNGQPSGVLSSAELCAFSTENPPTPALDQSTKPFSPPPSNIATSPLITLATSMLIITTCVVILTACVVILLSAWLVYVLIRRWAK